MSVRCLVVVCLAVAAQSAHIRTRNIPVEVVYENGNPLAYGTRNLDARIQLSSDELLKLKLSDDIINAEVAEETNHGVRNLDEKVQLSPEELRVSVRFSPNALAQAEAAKAEEKPNEPVKLEEKPQENNLLVLLKRAEEIAYTGVNAIKSNVDKASEAAANARPGAETWEKLNKTLNEFFTDQYKRANLKADNAPENQNQNNQIVEFFQGFMQNFQSVINNIQGPSSQKPPGGSEDEQTGQQGGQNFLQVFVSYVQNGISQMVSNANVQNPGTGGAAGQEDTGTGGGGGGGGGGNFFTNVGAFFQGILPQNQGNNPSNQSDTGVQPPSNPIQVFQQTISNAIGNFVSQGQPSTTAPVQGDEGTGGSSTTSGPFSIGNINQAISSGIQTIGQLGQGGSGGGSGGSGGLDQLTSIGNQIGQQLTGQGQGGNPIQQAVGQFTGQGGEGTNPVQAIGSQIGQITGGQAPNPLEGFQSALGGSSTEKAKAGEQEDELASPAPTTVPKASEEDEKKPAEVAAKVEYLELNI